MQSEISLFILSCDVTGCRQGNYTGMSCFLEPYETATGKTSTIRDVAYQKKKKVAIWPEFNRHKWWSLYSASKAETYGKHLLAKKNPECSKHTTVPHKSCLYHNHSDPSSSIPWQRNFEKPVQMQSETKRVCEIKASAKGCRCETCKDDIMKFHYCVLSSNKYWQSVLSRNAS